MFLNLTGTAITATMEDLDIEDFVEQSLIEQISSIMADAALTPDATELDHYAEELVDALVEDDYYELTGAEGVVIPGDHRIASHLTEYLESEGYEVMWLVLDFAGRLCLEYPK